MPNEPWYRLYLLYPLLLTIGVFILGGIGFALAWTLFQLSVVANVYVVLFVCLFLFFSFLNWVHR